MVRWLRWHCPPDIGFEIEPWRSEAEHATSRSQRLPTIQTFTRGWGRTIFVSIKPPRLGTEPRTLAWKAAVLTTTLGPPPTGPTAADNLINEDAVDPALIRHRVNVWCWLSGASELWTMWPNYKRCMTLCLLSVSWQSGAERGGTGTTTGQEQPRRSTGDLVSICKHCYNAGPTVCASVQRQTVVAAYF